MSKIAIHCPKCRTRYSIDTTLVGKKGRCKQCETSFVMDRSQGAAAAVPPRQQERRALAEDGIPIECQPGDVILCVYKVVGQMFKGRMGTPCAARPRR